MVLVKYSTCIQLNNIEGMRNFVFTFDLEMSVIGPTDVNIRRIRVSNIHVTYIKGTVLRQQLQYGHSVQH